MNGNVIDRRGFLGLGAALLAATAVSGCGTGGSSSGLRVAWYGGAPVHEALDKALAVFSGDHPDAQLASEKAAFNDYWDKLATQAAGGQAPDVFRMSMSYFTEYAKRGALLDLGEAGIRVGDLDPAVAGSGTVEGSTYGIGQSTITQAAFVNRAQIEALGLAVPQSGWTWEQFAQLARSFAAAAGDGRFGTFDAGGNLEIFDVFARQHGTDTFTADGALGAGRDVLEEWFTFWDGLRRDGAAPPADISAESRTFETSTLVAGRSPVQFGWVQQVTFYQQLMQDPLDVVAIPAGADGTLSGQFAKALDFWCVSSETGGAERAAQVIDFLVNDDRAIDAIGVTLGIPPSARARDRLAADQGSAAGRAVAFVESVSGQVGPSPAAWPQGYGELQATFQRVNEEVGFGQSDPARAAADFADEADRVLSS
ncbi:ABC transporter substrate-binding protein [Pseudonocardia kunmingensis]|uniref:Carbohydrate ABC transporter substrate-binding protein (CUT1 family) n=1 Tax=Pseudonocardia kunmingensis TaxID=630975 RepID=A0A543DNJ7_9PSEU|nr:extracellular solute-binding protein [Pseudonocardia kunmingensis]TQM10865.1 carbohydrate ABC transporter substrate-binding protein (CUT1 family) [Pseudonocardia kunmingensis]